MRAPEKALLQTTSSNGQEIYGSISSYLSTKSNRIESSFSIPSDLVDPIGHLVRLLKISCSVRFSMMERGAFLGLSSALGAKVPAPQNASKKWGKYSIQLVLSNIFLHYPKHAWGILRESNDDDEREREIYIYINRFMGTPWHTWIPNDSKIQISTRNWTQQPRVSFNTAGWWGKRAATCNKTKPKRDLCQSAKSKNEKDNPVLK